MSHALKIQAYIKYKQIAIRSMKIQNVIKVSINILPFHARLYALAHKGARWIIWLMRDFWNYTSGGLYGI